MGPLHADQVIRQSLDLHLNVGAAQGQPIQDLPQPGDVGLHRLPHGQLVLIPAAQQSLTFRQIKSGCIMLSVEGKRVSHSLHLEVLGGQQGVIDGEDKGGVSTSSELYLRDPKVRKMFILKICIKKCKIY